MKIFFSLSGGLMGIINKNITLDIDSMTTDEKKQFENLVITLDFFSIESDPPPTQGSADYLQYSITVEEGDKKHTVKTNDVTMSKQIEPFVNFLEKKIKR